MAVHGTTRKGIYHDEPKASRKRFFAEGPKLSERKSAHQDAPVLITEAQASYDVQHRARVKKYSILMAFRIPALVIAAVVYSATMIWWIPLLIVAASIPLPWMAVLIANDRPPRSGEEVNRYRYGDTVERTAIAPSQKNVIEAE